MGRLNVLLVFLAMMVATAQATWIEKSAPAFQLNALSGEPVSLAAHKGKVVFVHFWASWCMPCKEEFPKLNALAGDYSPDQLAVLGITVDKAQANIEKFLKKYVTPPLRVQVLRDPEGRVAESYQNRAMPITFVLDRQGVVRYMHMGFQKGDEARWRQEVDDLLHEGTANPMHQATGINMGMAFLAGLLSFVSPCVLPIVPSFLGFISGMSLDQMTAPDRKSYSVLIFTGWFVLGFSLVFIALGASATAVGALLLKYQKIFRIMGGLFIVVLGLQFMGLFQIGFLQADRRVHLASKPMGVLGSFLVGVTFALGWTPCIGPILGSILMIAASQANVMQGVWMLAVYSLGFALPFLAAAAALNSFLISYKRLAPYIPKIVFGSGAFLVGVGLLLMTNRFAAIAEFLTGWFSA